jgi:hypothetical protein
MHSGIMSHDWDAPLEYGRNFQNWNRRGLELGKAALRADSIISGVKRTPGRISVFVTDLALRESRDLFSPLQCAHVCN